MTGRWAFLVQIACQAVILVINKNLMKVVRTDYFSN